MLLLHVQTETRNKTRYLPIFVTRNRYSKDRSGTRYGPTYFYTLYLVKSQTLFLDVFLKIYEVSRLTKLHLPTSLSPTGPITRALSNSFDPKSLVLSLRGPPATPQFCRLDLSNCLIKTLGQRTLLDK